MRPVHAAEDADFRGPLDVTRAATAVLDADGTVIGWSPTAQHLLGYPPREVLGHPVTAFMDPEPGDPLTLDVTGETPFRRGELRVRHRDGRLLRVSAAMFPLFHAGDGAARLLTVADEAETERWEAKQSMLRGLATESPVGLAIYDMDLRVVWTNAALYEEMGNTDYIGLGPDDMVTHGEVLSQGRPGTLLAVMRQVLTTGEPVRNLHYRGRPPFDVDHDHVWSCSYYRLQDTRGTLLGVCEETFDITDNYRAQQRLDLLVRAGERVGTTLRMDRTARELAEVTVPGFADAVTVDLWQAVLEGAEPTPPGTAPTSRVIRVWGGPGGEATAPGGGTPEQRAPVDYAPDSPQARCLASGRPVLERAANDDRADGTGEKTPLRSQLAVPLRSEGATLGLVTFTRDRNPTPFDSGELELADELAARAAVCIDNARRFTREHTAALTLQRSLLPQTLPQQNAVEPAFRYLPADNKAGVGGDWFDVIALSGARVGLVVGDVVGHGLSAAATMGRLRTSVRVLAQLDLAPEELLSRLDDLVGQTAHEQAAVGPDGGEMPDDDKALGATCLYAVYDPVTGQCRMARAGHPPPLVVEPVGGSVSSPDLPAGPPLGTGGLPFESADLDLPEGSLIALFTDGLVQTHDRDITHELDRLGAVLSRHTRPLDDLCDEAVATLLPEAVDDDAALLLVRTRKLGGHQVAVWELPSDPEVVGRARAAAAGQVTEWGLDDLVFTTELVVSELVTNAIRYASGQIQVRLIRDRTLICEVSDAGHTSPHLRHAGIDDEGGRGLFLVSQMTQQWGTRYTPTGKTIWAEQTLPSAGPAPASDDARTN
ncbi:SpoIIE family protein phosphatase [Streptomyces sp. A3M-1-3]|uniref:SpoIIE family protein phosphatase n=1 Tax=Streptomyces sp. A3M-1-3 TaxID=2962044 RepID=UPI0020B894E0|nr:SpoIIE family protein phosphatase [Streptomyces sp. A3M-1-3]MCP3819677.1 SpoIIE family protein phosphatase [Streptomyces sp. A3M-1-3]